MPLAGILDDFLDVLLGVESSVGPRVVLLAVVAVGTPPLLPCVVGTPCREVGEAWVFLYLDAPSGTVGQVPVEAVHLEACQGVELLLDELLAGEVPRVVKVQATVLESGRVLDADGIYRLEVIRLGQLQQRLEAVEQPCRRRRHHLGTSAADCQCVALVALPSIGVDGQAQIAPAAVLARAGHGERRVLDESHEVVLVTAREVGDDVQRFGNAQFALLHLHLLRHGYDVLCRRGGSAGEEGQAEQQCCQFHIIMVLSCFVCVTVCARAYRPSPSSIGLSPTCASSHRRRPSWRGNRR